MQHVPLRRLLADTGQARKQGDELTDGRGLHGTA
jgi:hypothetical protein